MQKMRPRDAFPGETEQPTGARVREVRVARHREAFLHVHGQIEQFFFGRVDLSDWNVFAQVAPLLGVADYQSLSNILKTDSK